MRSKCGARVRGVSHSEHTELLRAGREGLLLRRIIRLYRFCLNDDRGITALHVLTLRGDRSCHVARRQTQRYRQAGQQGCHSRGCDFVDLLLCHDDN